ncbi:MAG TPA: hypothetical protein VI758_06120 [Bacteroidota bacterium]
MTYGAETAAVAAAIANAIRASGAIVRVEPESFSAILSKAGNPLVVVAEGGLFAKNYQYLTSYKGLIFFTKSPQPLSLGMHVEVIKAGKIWIPN